MEPFYRTYKPAWKSFYKLLILAIILIVAAFVVQSMKPGESWHKLMWIAVAVVDIFILCYIVVQRATMSLILKDNPDKAEDQEVAFVKCHPLKPFSSDFRESIEIGLANIVHIKVGQTIMQTLMKVGDIVITSSGTGSEEINAKNIPNPNVVRDEIQLHARRYTMPPAPITHEVQQ